MNTDLGGAGLHNFGEPLDEFVSHIIAKMEESDENLEIGFRMSEGARLASVEKRAGLNDCVYRIHKIFYNFNF